MEGMGTVYITEGEAALDFLGLLARVRGGAEVVIEKEDASAVLLRAAGDPPLRRLSESLRLAREHACAVTLDAGFGVDLEAVVASHPEALANPWA